MGVAALAPVLEHAFAFFVSWLALLLAPVLAFALAYASAFFVFASAVQSAQTLACE